MRHGVSLELKILLAFLAGGAILLGSGWFAVTSGRAYLAGDALTDSLHDAQRALLALELSLSDAESGARGYLLTGKQEYLRPYERALGEIDHQAEDARTLLAEQPEAVALYWQADTVIRLKRADLQHSIELRRDAGLEATLRALKTDTGAMEMREIHLQLDAIRKLLQVRIGAELARSVERSSSTLWWASAAGTVLAGLSIAAYLIIAWELRERRQLTARIERDANHDSLTQLPNRRFFEQWLSYTLAQARRDETHVALLFVDLDGFKAVNDRYGHKAGDALLAEVARRFRRSVRESDLLVRLGGDEFALIAPNARDDRELAQVAQRLLATLADPSEPLLSDPPLGASIGVAFFPEDARELSGLITAADEAMYTAKRTGRNRIAFYATAVATNDSTASAASAA